MPACGKLRNQKSNAETDNPPAHFSVLCMHTCLQPRSLSVVFDSDICEHLREVHCFCKVRKSSLSGSPYQDFFAVLSVVRSLGMVMLYVL